MLIYTVIKEKIQFLKTERNKYVVMRFLGDGAHLTSSEIQFQTEEAKENERSPSVAFAGQ